MVEEKPLADVTVSEVLMLSGKSRMPATVRKDATLKEASEALIRNRETRKVYVVDEGSRLVGTITLETLLRHAGYSMGVRSSGVTSFLKMLGEISKDKVSDSMDAPVKVLEDELIVNATKLMVENHLNDLPVVDDEGRLVGELNGLDILVMGKQFWG